MEQVVGNRVWGEMRGRLWNRWCGIVYGAEMRGRVGNRWCRIVYGDGVRGRVWNRWCRIVSWVRCEVVYITGGVDSCMGVGCDVV
jgi:hypothetical protein